MVYSLITGSSSQTPRQK